jgi:hypothetical protein
LLEIPETILVNTGIMNEHILLPFALDESIALGGVEPLYFPVIQRRPPSREEILTVVNNDFGCPLYMSTYPHDYSHWDMYGQFKLVRKLFKGQEYVKTNLPHHMPQGNPVEKIY